MFISAYLLIDYDGPWWLPAVEFLPTHGSIAGVEEAKCPTLVLG